jgi:hypothetical protein
MTRCDEKVVRIPDVTNWITGKPDEHGQEKWEGKQKGRSEKRITDSKIRQKEALHCAQI